MNTIGRITIELHSFSINPIRMSRYNLQEIALLQHPCIMVAAYPRSTQMCNDSIQSDNRLELQCVNTFMAIIDLTLLHSWLAYCPDGPINESPAPLKRGSFAMNGIGKLFQIISCKAPIIEL